MVEDEEGGGVGGEVRAQGVGEAGGGGGAQGGGGMRGA